MELSKTKRAYFLPTAVIVSLLIFAMPLLAQRGDMMAGRVAGEQAARASVNGTAWLAIGCFAGLVGIIIAAVVESSPPSTMLLGKSPEYVAGFTDAYKATAKSVRMNKAITGCIAGAVVNALLYVLLVAAASTTDTVY